MTSLKDINFGMNQYCGPAVLSALTGKSTDECASAISKISGVKEIKYVRIDHLIDTLKELRFSVTSVRSTGNSLYANLVAMKPGMYIVLIPQHVIAVEATETERYLIDNHTKSAIDARASARLMQTVQQIYKIEPLPPKKFVKTKIKARIINDRNIYIDWEDIYEDETDNVRGSAGTIYLRKPEDLKEIIKQLGELDGNSSNE